MSRPRILDLFCGAGGCAVGYHRAGFDVVGVDIKPQPRYPFRFIQMDAMDALGDLLAGRQLESKDRMWFAHHFDAIHASPPCQRYTIGRKIHNSGDRHPDLVEVCRLFLGLLEKPYVIENVMGSPLHYPSMLCGLMFGLRVLRHRLFECSFLLMTPPHGKHPPGNLTNAAHGYSTGAQGYVCVTGNNFVRTAGAKAMGIDWPMTREELAQAIPPAYTEFIGKQLLAVVCERTVA